VWIQKQIDDPPIEITLSLLTPFAAYLPAEQMHASGVLAVVVTGLYHGWRITGVHDLAHAAASRAGLGN